MKRRVAVDHYHIWHGIRNCSTFCPIVLAAEPALFRGGIVLNADGELEFYEVVWRRTKHLGIKLTGHGAFRFAVPLPPEAAQWMRDFDAGNPVVPFEFKVDLPDEGEHAQPNKEGPQE